MKLFTKEVRIAIVAIIGVVAAFLLINFLKGVNVFKTSNTYYVQFENIAGLSVSNSVFANGYPVGIVRSIQYDYQQNKGVLVGIDLDEEVTIPRGTIAELETSMMGDVKMNLVLGQNIADNLIPGDTIRGGMYQGAMAQAANLVPTVAQILPKLDSILTNMNRLSSDPALQQSLANAAEISANLSSLTANLNRMSQRDLPELSAQLNKIGANMATFSGNLAKVDVEETMQSVNGTLKEMNQLSQQMNSTASLLNTKLQSKDNSLGLLLNDRALYDNLNHTATSADSLLQDLRLRPKRYVHFSIFGRKSK